MLVSFSDRFVLHTKSTFASTRYNISVGVL